MRKFIFLWMVLLSVSQIAQAQSLEPRDGKWVPFTFSGESRWVPLWPDTKAYYWCYGVDFSQYPKAAAFKFTGDFHQARYMSFNLYSVSQGVPLNSLADREILADQGSLNPYVPGTDRGVTNRKYTVWVVREGSSLAKKNLPNEMIFSKKISRLAVILRVYGPDKGKDPRRELPRIEAFDEEGKKVDGPRGGFIQNLKAIAKALGKMAQNRDVIQQLRYFSDGKNVTFIRMNTSGAFPNAHNQYLVAGIGRWSPDKVVVVKFFPPSFEKTSQGGGKFDGKSQVRYWSLDVGTLFGTNTLSGLSDEEAKLNADGSVTVVIGPWRIKDEVEKKGLNFLPWKISGEGCLIFRHMLPRQDFKGSVGTVPQVPFPLSFSAEKKAEFSQKYGAENHIGKYSPTGEIHSVKSFRKWLALQ